MSNVTEQPARGRPKTLDRDFVLEVAMKSYWQEGVGNISLNEVCRRAKISKPALYREFGNEDGLIKAALEHYHKKVLVGVERLFSGQAPFENAPFEKVIDLWISIAIDDSANLQRPAGCLFVALSGVKPQLGAASQQYIDHVEEEVVQIYQRWFERSKENGEYKSELSPERAARYLHAQFCHAMSQKSAGKPDEQIKDVLRLALSVLRA